MLEYILAALLLVVAFLYNRWILEPKKKMAYYTKIFRKHGYKVV